MFLTLHCHNIANLQDGDATVIPSLRTNSFTRVPER